MSPNVLCYGRGAGCVVTLAHSQLAIQLQLQGGWGNTLFSTTRYRIRSEVTEDIGT